MTDADRVLNQRQLDQADEFLGLAPDPDSLEGILAIVATAEKDMHLAELPLEACDGGIRKRNRAKKSRKGRASERHERVSTMSTKVKKTDTSKRSMTCSFCLKKGHTKRKCESTMRHDRDPDSYMPSSASEEEDE